MILLSQLKALTLDNPSHADRHAHLSAASGLVQAGAFLYVVADDEKHIGIFNEDDNESGILRRLFPGDLPLTLEERKVEKPDLEVLTFIPISEKYPYGALLLLGSGSKKNRTQGVIIPFDESGNLHNNLKIIDLTMLYHHIEEEIGKLNIEGGVIVNEDIILFQRGNKKNNVNASIRFPLEQFYQYVLTLDSESTDHEPKDHEPKTHKSKGHKHKQKLDVKVTHYSLGEIAGVPLCFTDATSLPDGTIVFTAAAENTSDAYLDGACLGSVIGVINSSGELHSLHEIDKIVKAEGIEAHVIANIVHLLVVTDSDDATAAATLYSGELHGYPFTSSKN